MTCKRSKILKSWDLCFIPDSFQILNQDLPSCWSELYWEQGELGWIDKDCQCSSQRSGFHWYCCFFFNKAWMLLVHVYNITEKWLKVKPHLTKQTNSINNKKKRFCHDNLIAHFTFTYNVWALIYKIVKLSCSMFHKYRKEHPENIVIYKSGVKSYFCVIIFHNFNGHLWHCGKSVWMPIEFCFTSVSMVNVSMCLYMYLHYL